MRSTELQTLQLEKTLKIFRHCETPSWDDGFKLLGCWYGLQKMWICLSNRFFKCTRLFGTKFLGCWYQGPEMQWSSKFHFMLRSLHLYTLKPQKSNGELDCCECRWWVFVSFSCARFWFWKALWCSFCLVCRYGHLTWEWQQGLRSYLHPLLFAALYKLLTTLHLDTPWFMVCSFQPFFCLCGYMRVGISSHVVI
jgi:hypothetical protein